MSLESYHFLILKSLTNGFSSLSMDKKGWILHLNITAVLIFKSRSIPEPLDYWKVWFNSALCSWCLQGSVKSRLTLHKGKAMLVQYKGNVSSCHFPPLYPSPRDFFFFFFPSSMDLNQPLIRANFLWKMMLERHQFMQSLKSQSKMITSN